MKKTLLAVIGILFIGLLAWRLIALIQSKTQAASQGMGGRPPVAVEIATASIESIRDVRQFTGTVSPLYQYIVSPKVSGRVIEIRKRIGDPVRKGEVIARIDDAEYQQAVLEAEANLQIAKASLVEVRGQAELVKQELDRAQSLLDKGISSTAEYDAAVTSNTAQQARLKLAEAQVDQRAAALNSARIRLGYTILAATEPGYVGERFVDEGALLAPNSPVITIVGIDRVIVRTTIIERDYGSIQVGQKTTVQVDAFPEKSFPGIVSRIAPMLEEASRVAKTEVEVDNPEHTLKPGMFARVNVVLAQSEAAQVVPASSIVASQGNGGETGIYVVENNSQPVARFVPVKTGIISTDKVEILSPKLTSPVVTLGQHLLSDDSPIILPKAKTGENKGEKKGQSDKATGRPAQ